LALTRQEWETVGSIAAKPDVDRKRLAMLSLGHAVTDSYGQSLLTPLFPLLAARLGLSLTLVGGLPMVMGLSSSLGQPLLGHLSDRYPRLCLIALGPAVAALCVGLVGLAPSYAWLLVCLFLAGIGIGAYHPQGALLARRAAGGRSLAMAGFTVGGSIGFGLAPLLGALGLRLFGLERFYWMALPGLLFAFVLGRTFARAGAEGLTSPPSPLPETGRGSLPSVSPSWGGETSRRAAGPIADRHPSPLRGGAGGEVNSRPYLRGEHSPSASAALAFLTASVMVRAAVQIGIITFLPFYLTRYGFAGMQHATAQAMAASLFLLANAVGGPLGGHLSDRLGRRRVMAATFLLAPWPLWLAFHTPGYGCLIGLVIGGFLLTMPHPANVVMAQELMPHRAGVAASLITGLAWGLAQVLALPLGSMADHFGVAPTLQVLSLLPLLGVLFTLPIPETAGARR
jgi:FSR family fosmidomycin resistance protein-like MFS transporter